MLLSQINIDIKPVCEAYTHNYIMKFNNNTNKMATTIITTIITKMITIITTKQQ